MLFRTHLVFGVFVYFILDYFLEMPFWVLGFILLGAVLVDIDVKNSFIGKGWYFRPLQFLAKHRGFLHSLVFGFLFSLIIGNFSLWGGFGFFVGYLSHLFLDCLTKSGVRLFWPFRYKIKGFARSGGIFEDVIFVLLLLGDIGLVVVSV